MVRPEIKIFIAALRAGKPSAAAFAEYCWARDAVPVRINEECEPEHWQVASTMAEAEAWEAFVESGDDEAISAAFERGAAADRATFGIRWRVMSKNERPTQGQLIRSLSQDSRDVAISIFGIAAVAKGIVSR